MGVVVARHGQARTQKPCRGLPRLLQETVRTQTTTLIPCSMRASGHVYLPACLHVDMLSRSEAHTSELKSLIGTWNADFCLNNKNHKSKIHTTNDVHIKIVFKKKKLIYKSYSMRKHSTL